MTREEIEVKGERRDKQFERRHCARPIHLDVVADPEPPRLPAVLMDYSMGGFRIRVPREDVHLLQRVAKVRLGGASASKRWQIERAGTATRFGFVDAGFAFERPLEGESLEVESIVEDLEVHGDAFYEKRPEKYTRHELGEKGLLNALLRVFGFSYPLENIVTRLVKVAGCTHAHVRHGLPGDSDYGYLERRYRSGDRVGRIDFFRTDDSDTVARLEYLGYVELRPSRISYNGILLGHVARAVIVYPEKVHSERRSSLMHNKDCYAYTAQVELRTVLDGDSQKLIGVPYQQQSVVHGNCVHASVAMTSEYMSRIFRSRRLLESEVRSSLVHEWMPSLNENDIVASLSNLGFNVYTYHCNESQQRSAWMGAPGVSTALAFSRFSDVMHIAADSCLPGILICDGANGDRPRHAVMLVGHTSRVAHSGRASNVSGGSRASVGSSLTTTNWVEDWVVHDDAVGPYLQIPVRRQGKVSEADDPGLCYAWNRTAEEHARVFIMPLPKAVRYAPHLAHSAAFHWMDLYIQKACGTGILPKELDDRLRVHGTDALVLGAYLDHGEHFRIAAIRELRDRHLAGNGSGTRAAPERHGLRLPNKEEVQAEIAHLIQAALPPYVFVCSVALREDIEQFGPFEAPCIGYILIDATATEYYDEPVVAARIVGGMTYHDSVTGKRRTPTLCPRVVDIPGLYEASAPPV